MIGVFDIGVGGLSVVKTLKDKNADYPILYFGDTGRLPYSTKPPEDRLRYSIQDAEFVVKHGAEILVIACNTISAVAGPEIERRFGLPTFNVIDAGVRVAARVTTNKRIGIIGSKALTESPVYPERLRSLDPEIETFLKNCQLFVYLIEENYLGYPETFGIARNLLDDFNRQGIDTLILGCTHFPLLRAEIQAAVGSGVTLVDPAVEIAGMVAEYLDGRPEIRDRLTRDREDVYYISGDSPQVFREIARRFLGREIERVEMMSWDG